MRKWCFVEEAESIELLTALEKLGYVVIKGLGLDNPNAGLKKYISAVARPIAYPDLTLVMDLKPVTNHHQPISGFCLCQSVACSYW